MIESSNITTFLRSELEYQLEKDNEDARTFAIIVSATMVLLLAVLTLVTVTLCCRRKAADVPIPINKIVIEKNRNYN